MTKTPPKHGVTASYGPRQGVIGITLAMVCYLFGAENETTSKNRGVNDHWPEVTITSLDGKTQQSTESAGMEGRRSERGGMVDISVRGVVIPPTKVLN